MARRNSESKEVARKHNRAYAHYKDMITEFAISGIEWKNMPDTIDTRYLELILLRDGVSVFFQDEVLGYLCLPVMLGGQFNNYEIPEIRTAYSVSNYQVQLDSTNSVLIYNNMLHTGNMLDVEYFTENIFRLDMVIGINADAQKTPILISCDEPQRLTLKNLYMKYVGNEPVIYGDKNLNPNALKVLKTDAPYVADKLYELKVQLWNEMLTFFGISNINTQKKERMITDEVSRNLGGVIARRFSRLNARKQGCKQINKMFGLNISCDYREDFQLLEESNNDGGENNG